MHDRGREAFSRFVLQLPNASTKTTVCVQPFISVLLDWIGLYCTGVPDIAATTQYNTSMCGLMQNSPFSFVSTCSDCSSRYSHRKVDKVAAAGED